MFTDAGVADRDMGVIVSRLERVGEIQKLLIQQIDVLESMSALDFLSFRDFLYPASGFQSVQFRRIENMLGLVSGQRLSYGGRRGYCSVLNEEDAAAVASSEGKPSLFTLMEGWLERCPFLEFDGGEGGEFSFWQHYRQAVNEMLDADEAYMKGHASAFTPDTLAQHLRDVDNQRAHFSSLLDPEKYAGSLERGERRLSYRATQAALMIIFFQHEPGLHLPYRLLSALMEVDERLCAWRNRHAQMVHVRVWLGVFMVLAPLSGPFYIDSYAHSTHTTQSFFYHLPRLCRECWVQSWARGVAVGTAT